MVKWWLIKSEPSTYSIDTFRKERTTLWDGVRNYQARNFLQDMRVGDKAFFYHSNVKEPAIVGIAEVAKEAVADPTQFDSSSEYFDPKASTEKPRWFCPKFKFLSKFEKPVSRDDLRAQKGTAGMALLKKGQRLSVLPITASEASKILQLADRNAE